MKIIASCSSKSYQSWTGIQADAPLQLRKEREREREEWKSNLPAYRQRGHHFDPVADQEAGNRSPVHLDSVRKSCRSLRSSDRSQQLPHGRERDNSIICTQETSRRNREESTITDLGGITAREGEIRQEMQTCKRSLPVSDDMNIFRLQSFQLLISPVVCCECQSCAGHETWWSRTNQYGLCNQTCTHPYHKILKNECHLCPNHPDVGEA